MNRRTFLEFLGLGTFGLALSPNLAFSSGPKKLSWPKPIPPSSADQLILSEGLRYELLISWKDKISDKDFFGHHNDYLAFLNLEEGPALWVNHEYMDPLFVSGFKNGERKTKSQIDLERYEVGGSLLALDQVNGKWKVIPDSPLNYRLTGTSKIPFAWKEAIQGQNFAIGTMGNCAGGVCPNGNILTCEENYQDYYGDRDREGNYVPGYYQWSNAYDLPPEHYGWVVEFNPITKESRKLVSLGRMAHECATVSVCEDGRWVVYTGDDKENEHLYKFIGSKPGSLTEGKLYVANFEEGKWLSLDLEDQPILKKNFSSQTEVLIHCREAAKLLRATPLDRPEDIQIDPITRSVMVAATKNLSKENYYGSILKIMEEGNHPDALNFKSETFVSGGLDTGFACPDNIAFDPAGNLWFTTDISGWSIEEGPYSGFGNNALFAIPRWGETAGIPIRIATAPVDAELTGPCFSSDGKTLFLSVQHPGETTNDLSNFTSSWPGKPGEMPKSSVVAIQGDLLNQIAELR